MTTDMPSPAPATPPPAAPLPARKKSWLLYGCGGFLALLLIIFATVAITLWWIQRPIKPVVLTAPEKAAVDAKLEQLSGGNARASAKSPAPAAQAPARNRQPGATPPALENAVPSAPDGGRDRTYVPGGKVLRLTEREINGLLNVNTELGTTVRLEFARDAVNAYMAVPIPQDFPVGGGRTFRARGRFSVSLGNGGAPYAVLEDVSILGLSLPKAWLGGLKGQNLLGNVMGQGQGQGTTGFPGIKSLRVEPGALVLEVED